MKWLDGALRTSLNDYPYASTFLTIGAIMTVSFGIAVAHIVALSCK